MKTTGADVRNLIHGGAVETVQCSRHASQDSTAGHTLAQYQFEQINRVRLHA